jgi:hypothetical protein
MATLALISMRHPLTPNPTQIVVRNTIHGHTLDARRIVTIAPRVCELRLMGNLPTEPVRTIDGMSNEGHPDPQ